MFLTDLCMCVATSIGSGLKSRAGTTHHQYLYQVDYDCLYKLGVNIEEKDLWGLTGFISECWGLANIIAKICFSF